MYRNSPGKINSKRINFINSQSNYQKQTQNVRRRIYDAINVMTAIGLVVKNSTGEMYIRLPERSNPVCAEDIKHMVEKDNIMNQEQSVIENHKKMIA